MRSATILAVVLSVSGPASAAEPEAQAPDKAKRERLLQIYRGDAAKYAIYRDSSRKEKAELRREPVYLWTNPLRSGGQDGALFVWTYRGRPEAIASIFSDPAVGPRALNHELQSLATTVLDVSRPPPASWAPEGPGVDLEPIAGAPAPAGTPKARLAQMRTLARDFSGHTVDRDEKRWELRLLPQPLYRYESTDPDVLDGALFAYVTSAGTDPEALVLLEARRPARGGEPAWHYAVARFTDLDLWVLHKGAEVFTAKMCTVKDTRQDPKHRYRLFNDRKIPAVEDAPATAGPNPPQAGAKP